MTFFNRLLNKPNISFYDFVSAIKSGEKDIFRLIGVPQSAFQTATFNELMANQGDVLSGVNKVLIRLNKNYFDFFDNSLVKYHDNGDIKFIFFTTTSNADKIIDFAKILFDVLGPGIHHDDKFIPFTNEEKIYDLSKNRYSSFKDILHLWILPDVNFLLQYKINPLKEFSLMITLRAPTIIDRSARSKGTVLSILDFNIHALLNTDPINFEPHFHDGVISSITYTYELPISQVNIFDRIDIRLFGTERKFSNTTQSNLSLYSSIPLLYKQKLDLVHKLISIYGSDNLGSADLEAHELDMLEAKEFWVGRNWTLNKAHTIWDQNDKSESIVYQVHIFDFADEKGFQLDILGFNELYALFSEE